MKLHIYPKISSIKSLREIGYDSSRSASKTDKEQKEYLSSTYLHKHAKIYHKQEDGAPLSITILKYLRILAPHFLFECALGY